MRVTDLARRSTGRVFCSKECRGRIGSKPRSGETKPCPVCGNLVYSTAAVPRRYCSKRCHNDAQRADRLMTRCATCGVSFQHQRSVPSKYCGSACYEASRRSTAVGRDHNGRPVRRTAGGYQTVYEPDHPRAYRHGYVLEHRHVMEQSLGRLLEPGEVVHHLNGKKWDNRPENLELMEHGEHSTLTAAELKSTRAAVTAELDEYRRRFGPLT